MVIDTRNFTNVNIKKEQGKRIGRLIIALLLIAISLGCKYWEIKTIEKANKNITDLNSIIVSSDDKGNKKAYLDAQSIPYKFAVYDDTSKSYYSNSYYIVSDDKYLYIVYMSPSDFSKLNKEDIYDNPIRIEGVTKFTTKDIKKLAISAYNRSVENDEDKITLADFDNYFGSVYLDTIVDSPVANIQFCLFLLFMLVGVITLITQLVPLISFKSRISKLEGVSLDELDKEMNSKDAFYYEKAHLYLTDHYIINFGGMFRIIRYEDILWMYPFEQRTNGIKTSQSIKVLTNDGKTSTIATIDVITKKKKEAYEEIWSSILEKNNTMLLGYTKENIDEMKQKVKEIKKSKKM